MNAYDNGFSQFLDRYPSFETQDWGKYNIERDMDGRNVLTGSKTTAFTVVELEVWLVSPT